MSRTFAEAAALMSSRFPVLGSGRHSSGLAKASPALPSRQVLGCQRWRTGSHWPLRYGYEAG